MTRSTRTARAVALAAAAVLTLGLAACGADDGTHMDGSMMGGSSASAPDAAADHNEADVMFNAMMVPHHLQAIEMADLVPDRTRNPEVLDLSRRIRGAQQPEVDRMTGWLAAWGARPMDGHGAEGHDGHAGADGMMTEEDLVELGSLRDAAFDRRWLELMVEHHEGAVEMAQAVLRDGRHGGTRVLAGQVIESQQQEIDEMKGHLAR